MPVHRLQFTVAVPDIVIDEVIGNYRKQLDEKNIKFQNAQKDLGKIINLNKQTISVSQEIITYENWLNDLIKENGILILPYPKIPLKDLVQKSYENTKPFKEKGEGYKDYLIWETIKNHIKSKNATPPNYFLTNNTKDFGEKDSNDKYILHPDLAKQIEEETQEPTLYTSLKSIFDNVLAPNFQNISFKEMPDFNADYLQEMVSECVYDLRQHNAFAFENIPTITDVHIIEVNNFEIDEIKPMKIGDQIIINANGTVEIEISGFMEKHAYYSAEIDDKLDISIDDSNWNDYVMAVNATIETKFELNIFYSFQNKEVTGFELFLPQEINNN